ncbi:methylthioribose kinase [Sporosarcina thermotolerans]|uniref:Methylthioribose kinase n=1 Tax=Sporosarcina thermotolerans TaxID=633404 RepID=A0AAW9A7P4_9BACL|nr:methylthioribose kinase [Sporosarcina thermotolerans]MDW0115840.1 methylthioribose kinase [Sporosarcina thermotolerans]WHT46928.1 methylthioribose kinase [Sporosarcina thermotolerans]
MLQQYFIELGEGYGDIFELVELMKTNQKRLHRTFIFSSNTNGGQAISLAAVFHPAQDSKFMPIYICREGIKQIDDKKSKRRVLFEKAAEEVGQEPIFIELKHSSEFADHRLFYQYITGILRLNHLVPPLQ